MDDSEKGVGYKLKSRLRLLRLIVYYSAAGITIYYFILSSLAPVRYVRTINRIHSYDTLSAAIPDMRLLTDSLYLNLSAQRSFAVARAKMATSDSAGLAVNLTDSTLTLEIKGVTVRTIPVISFRTAYSLEGIDHYAMTSLGSSPFIINYSESTIPKEPIMVTIAPRDTAEASRRLSVIPDTSVVAPVCFQLRLDSGIRLVIMQDCAGNSGDCRKVRRFLFRLAVRDAWGGIKNSALIRMPEYEPEIRIVVSKADARIIYRALPYNGMVAIRFR